MLHADKYQFEDIYNRLVDKAYNDGFADGLEAAVQWLAEPSQQRDHNLNDTYLRNLITLTRTEKTR